MISRSETMIKTKDSTSTISFAFSQGYEIIPIEQILYCQADGNYATIYLLDQSKIVVSKPLKFIAHKINSAMFMRVHQSYLVNTNYVRKLITKGGFSLMLLGEISIPISRKYKAAVLQRFS